MKIRKVNDQYICTCGKQMTTGRSMSSAICNMIKLLRGANEHN